MSRITRALRRAGPVAVLASAAALAPVGVPSPAGALVGGTEVPVADFPFVATYGPAAGPIQGRCTGTVVAPTVVLTAAHCAAHVHPGFVHVHVGGQSYSVHAKELHPRWNGDPADGHDLALLRVNPVRPIPVTPVTVGSPWDPGAGAPGAPATIASFTGPFPNGTTIGRVDSPLRTDAEMAVAYSDWNSRFMVGAGSSTATTCTWDDGAPALVQRAGTWVQVGVSSFTAAACDRPGGFAELTGAQLAWVGQTVPSVRTGWGSCTTPAGNPGRSGATYTSNAFPGAQPDGNWWWRISCDEIPPPPPPPDPEPEPESEPEPEPEPEPPICRIHPWKCPIEP